MSRILYLSVLALLASTGASLAEPRVVCTLVKEVGAKEALLEAGDCNERISSASTFKIAISLMGFDSDILQSTTSPVWEFQQGYTDWNPAWREDTTPERWMRLSVVWFSQKITESLGEQVFKRYVEAFDYGNRDITGDKGQSNGLTHAWLSSSLQISPLEEVGFLTKMLTGALPVTVNAVEQTKLLLKQPYSQNGWQVYGKTGAGMPFDENGELMKGQPFGWYVGWAEKNDRKIVFARLVRFSERPESTPAIIARDGMLKELFSQTALE